jgi:hypothetical protein
VDDPLSLRSVRVAGLKALLRLPTVSFAGLREAG